MEFLIIVVGIVIAALIMARFSKMSGPSSGTSNAVFGATQDMLDKEKQNALKEIHMSKEQKIKEEESGEV